VDAFVDAFRVASTELVRTRSDLPVGVVVRLDDRDPETGWDRSAYLYTDATGRRRRGAGPSGP
jgi:hypothetical protein